MRSCVPVVRLEDICALLDGLGCRYTLHQNDEDYFSYLKNDEVSVEIPNPYTERTMFIDFQDEISLFFGEDWHCHYSPDEECFHELCKTIRGIMSNELCSVGKFSGEGRQFGGCLGAKSNECKRFGEYFAVPVSRLIEEYSEAWADEDENIEVRFKFWNPKFDKTVKIEKK